MNKEKILNSSYSHPMDKLKDIMAILRSENGCQWDKEQDHKSLIPCLLEESYEVVDAIEREDHIHLKEELGDLLFQSVFHARLAEERGNFDLESVIEDISEKLIRRHPHVFATNEGISSAEDVVKQWEAIKEEEKAKKSQLYNENKKDNKQQKTDQSQQFISILESIPHSFPAILKSQKIQSKVAKVGFDWENWQDPIDKLWEEINELKEELSELSNTHSQEPKIQKDKIHPELKSRIESELGDVLFSIVNVSRHLGIDPEEALRKTNNKFSNRFQFIEKEALNRGKSLKDMKLGEMDELWNQAKKKESRQA